MNKTEELKGLVKEVAEGVVGAHADKVTEIETKLAAKEEADAKFMEEHTELKDKYDDLQGRIITLKQNTGTNSYVFKGYDPVRSKNFKANFNSTDQETICKAYLECFKNGGGDLNAMLKAVDASNAIGVQYGGTLMGLAERSSVALRYFNVIQAEDPVINLPSKATRGSTDWQASGTANTEDTPTLGQITWTIDKRVGNYIELLNSQIEDAKFDLVGEWIIPMQAEAVGQDVDDEAFNSTGGEFTSSIDDATASVTVSGSVAIAAAINFDNLNDMYMAPDYTRIGPEGAKWFGPQAALAATNKLVDDNGQPLRQVVPLDGRPGFTLMGAEFVLTPAIANAPADGKIRLAFGDPRHYTIFVRGGTFVSMVNPYIKMKEDVTQFICKARMDGNISDHATPSSSGAWTTMKRVDA